MNQLEQSYGVLDINRVFAKSSSPQLRLETLANYGIHIKKEYIEEATTILFQMVKSKFLNALQTFSITDMFNEKSHLVLRTYLEHYSMESTSYNEAYFILDYFEHSCLNIDKKGVISKIFFKKYNAEILKLLKDFLKDQDTINEKKNNLITKYLQFVFVTQMNSGIICKNNKTYLKFQSLNFSEYLLNNCNNNTEEEYSNITIPDYLPVFIRNDNYQMASLRAIFRRSKGFDDYIGESGMIRNSLITRELKALSNEVSFINCSYDLRLKAYINLLSKAFKTHGLSGLFANNLTLRESFMNAVVYYESVVYNLNTTQIDKLKRDLISSL